MRPILSAIVLSGACVAFGLGCEARPGFYPNQDPTLREPIKTLRADGSQRLYPSEAPRVKGIAARAQIGYMSKTIDVANLGDEDWKDVEVWVNETYVCFLPIVQHGVLKSIPFNALFDREGNYIPRNSSTFIVQSVEVYIGGKLYEVKTQLPH
jgi:hypothetical protein